jgi:hypothetical protein
LVEHSCMPQLPSLLDHAWCWKTSETLNNTWYQVIKIKTLN